LTLNTRLVTSLAVITLASASIAAQEIPRFESAECPFEGVSGRDDVDCGYLVVHESRGSKESRTLRLAVAILRSTAEAAHLDPLVFLSGGPGGKTVEHTAARLESPFWDLMRKQRDLIFYDQRGTGYSDPEFCPEMDLVFYQGRLRGLPAAELQELETGAALECREKMLAEGIDFAAYNSATSALDLDDLRKVLGYESWNLFGISYGTRLALSAMRDTPEGIRSVVLDSVLPPNVPSLLDGNRRLARSLRLVFDQCAAVDNCRQAFPDLEGDFYAMLEDLEQEPIELVMEDEERFPGSRVVVDGTLMTDGVFQGLYDRNFIPILPLLIREIGNRNVDVLRALADGLVIDPHDISTGLHWAVSCYECDLSSTTLEADRAEHPELAVWHEKANQYAVCDTWHAARAGAEERQPVVSDIPALVAAGAFDPITPPDYARTLVETLANSLVVEAPAIGHGVLPFDECTRTLMVEFLDDPAKPLDLACLEELPEVSFVTDVTLQPGIYKLLSGFQQGLDPMVVALIGSILLLLSSIVIWPLGWLIRKMRRRSHSLPGRPGARWLASATSLVCLGFLGGLAAAIGQTLSTNPFLLAFGLSGGASPLFLLPWVALVLTGTLVIVAIVAWKNRWWTLVGRIHYSAITAASVAYVAFAASQGLL